MASLDFIGDTSKGYAFLWHHRMYLAQHAIPVIFIKLVCVFVVLLINANGSILRENLLLMPAYIIEAYFLMNVIRFALYKEPIFIWGKYIPLAADKVQDIEPQPTPSMPRATALKAGVCVYMLIKVIMGALVGYLNALNLQDREVAQPNIIMSLMALSFLAVLFWSVRLIWSYIPYSLGFSFSYYMQRIKGLSNSLYFLGVFIITFFPLILLYAIFSPIIATLFGQITAVHILLDSLLQAVIILMMTVIQVVAMSYGLYQLLTSQNKS